MEKAISKGLSEMSLSTSSPSSSFSTSSGKSNVSHYFKSVDPTPLAAASIGQVGKKEACVCIHVCLKCAFS
jgi:hypothetical protein